MPVSRTSAGSETPTWASVTSTNSASSPALTPTMSAENARACSPRHHPPAAKTASRTKGVPMTAAPCMRIASGVGVNESAIPEAPKWVAMVAGRRPAA